jgi:hypothetical protein
MKFCIDCDSLICEQTGLCEKCGRRAFKLGRVSDFGDLEHIEPYLPGEPESGLDSYEKITGRVSPIKTEPIKTKIPTALIISNVAIVVGIIILLIIFYFS